MNNDMKSHGRLLGLCIAVRLKYRHPPVITRTISYTLCADRYLSVMSAIAINEESTHQPEVSANSLMRLHTCKTAYGLSYVDCKNASVQSNELVVIHCELVNTDST
jgi:hypothetical protein